MGSEVGSNQSNQMSEPTSAQRGYGYKWQKARESFLKKHPLCVFHGQQGRTELATVVDHKVPPRMKEAIESNDPEQLKEARRLFWDRNNWQSLCKTCHDSIKQRMEKSGAVVGCTLDGLPLDSGHHWNR